MMKLSSTSIVHTPLAPRYAKQFISHWGRHTEPEVDGAVTRMHFDAMGDFPATGISVEVRTDELVLVACADDDAALRANCDSVAEHLHRFAGKKEQLSIVWS
ncbi:hypothetical protein GCM10022381_25550 [Leifsonia kafniensis]|uniref:DUF2218 domain-containing protein n=1 Tax=Leifsonia kafniensis TaxID=475957 RepID=A0ABP7KPQ2_9MICO